MKRKGLLLVIVALLMVSACINFAGGHSPVLAETAIEESRKVVYISTLGEFLEYTYDNNDEGLNDYFEKKYNNLTLVLTRDIDLKDDTSWHKYVPDWETYGWEARDTCANIDGNGYTISGLWARTTGEMNGARTIVAFIKNMQHNFVRNLNIVYDNSKLPQFPEVLSGDPTVYQEGGYYGGLADYTNCSNISNVRIKGNFYSVAAAGGIVRWSAYSTITHCSFEGDMQGGELGGIVCYSPNNIIKNCFYKGSLYGVLAGGIAATPVLADDATVMTSTTFENNIAIIERLVPIKLFWYISEYQPFGTIFGLTPGMKISDFVIKNNYVLAVDGFSHASVNPGASGLEHGSETQAINFEEDEVATIDELEEFANVAKFPKLDFENHWYMDEDKGYPQLKNLFVSIINLTDDNFDGNFSVLSDEKFYNANETASIEFDIEDKFVCQLSYLMLDGADILATFTSETLELSMDTNHTLVVKADTLGELIFDAKNVDKLTINGSQENVVDSQDLKYNLGDTITFSFAVKDGYEIKAVDIDNGLTLTKNEDIYSIVTTKQSTLNVQSIKITISTQQEPSNYLIYFIIGSIGIVALFAFAIVCFSKIRKRGTKN